MRFKTLCIATIILLLCAGGVAKAVSVRLVPCWAVFDANNKKISVGMSAVENEHWLGSFLQIQGHIVHIILGREYIYNWYYPGYVICHEGDPWITGVVYPDADCAGEPYIVTQNPDQIKALPPWEMLYVVPPGKRVFIETGAQEAPQAISYLSAVDCEGNCITYPDPLEASYAFEAVELVDLETIFTPPFQLRSVPCPWTGPPGE